MPIYEFKCCGQTFGVDRPIDRRPESAECPICHESTSDRDFSPYIRKPGRVRRDRGAEKMDPTDGGNVHGTVINAVCENNGLAGMHIGPGSRVRSIGGIYRNNGVADVENYGYLDSIDDQIG
jgi:putative FmdB family regulatory protein